RSFRSISSRGRLPCASRSKRAWMCTTSPDRGNRRSRRFSTPAETTSCTRNAHAAREIRLAPCLSQARRGGLLGRARLQVVRDQMVAQQPERVGGSIGATQQSQILFGDGAPLGKWFEIEDLVPVLAAIEQHV